MSVRVLRGRERETMWERRQNEKKSEEDDRAES